MPDNFGGNTRFRSATNINHSRAREPASGIPRSPGRPEGRGDTMPRNRGDSPQKTGVPGWAKALLQNKPPGWAQRGPQQTTQPTGFIEPHAGRYDQPARPSPPGYQPPEGQMTIQPIHSPQDRMPVQPTRPSQQQRPEPASADMSAVPVSPHEGSAQLALRKRLAMLMGRRRR